ncbi:unnamed protein product [Linum trigynum]
MGNKKWVNRDARVGEKVITLEPGVEDLKSSKEVEVANEEEPVLSNTFRIEEELYGIPVTSFVEVVNGLAGSVASPKASMHEV